MQTLKLVNCTVNNLMSCMSTIWHTHKCHAWTPCDVHTNIMHERHVAYTQMSCMSAMWRTHKCHAWTPCDVHANVMYERQVAYTQMSCMNAMWRKHKCHTWTPCGVRTKYRHSDYPIQVKRWRRCSTKITHVVQPSQTLEWCKLKCCV